MIIMEKLIKIQKKVLIKRWILKTLLKIVKTKKDLKINKLKIIKIKGKNQIKIRFLILA